MGPRNGVLCALLCAVQLLVAFARARTSATVCDCGCVFVMYMLTCIYVVYAFVCAVYVLAWMYVFMYVYV